MSVGFPDHSVRERLLDKLCRLTTNVICRGFIDLLHSPRSAIAYWRHVARAAAHPPKARAQEPVTLREVDIGEILSTPDSIPVDLVEYQYTYGDMPLHELITLCRIVRGRQPRLVLEIGTYLGGTTLQLAANSEAEVYTLDLPPQDRDSSLRQGSESPEADVCPEQPGVRFHGSVHSHRIRQLLGDSRIFDFEPYYGRVDLVLVDACHRYESVMRDSQNALSMSSASGVVVWHDYGPGSPGVLKALNEIGTTVPLLHLRGTSLVVYERSRRMS